VVVLIGERPRLTSPSSLGAYLTFAPRVGRTDAQRKAAARRIDWIAAAGVARGVTGVGLKDESGLEHDFLG
jgi:ethanolamine ammonia-lyase small subunit